MKCLFFVTPLLGFVVLGQEEHPVCTKLSDEMLA